MFDKAKLKEILASGNKIIHYPPAVNVALYEMLMDVTGGVPGVFMEMGIANGRTFDVIYQKAIEYSKNVVALDSFRGMPAPRMPGDKAQPEGKFDTGGSNWFKSKYQSCNNTGVFVYEGFIPEILKKVNEFAIAFVHIDLDHQLTTKEALEWAWSRLSDKGIVVCHDFQFTSNVSASMGIKNWMKENDVNYIGYCDASIWFRKGVK